MSLDAVEWAARRAFIFIHKNTDSIIVGSVEPDGITPHYVLLPVSGTSRVHSSERLNRVILGKAIE